MSFKPYLFGFVLLPWLVILVNGAGQQPDLAGDSGIPCEVTAPNGISAGAYEASPHDYGTLQLSVGPFGLWPEGTVVFKPGGAGFVTRDGALGMKWGWQRAVRGRLQITGRRLDAPAPTLRTEVLDGGRGAPQFLATYLIFPTDAGVLGGNWPPR
jgi:hypothetical protein